MKIEDQVCSLGLAKKLKELGIEQSCHFKWVEDRDDGSSIVTDIKSIKTECDFVYSAFTVAELWDMFPTEFTTEGKHRKIYCEIKVMKTDYDQNFNKTDNEEYTCMLIEPEQYDSDRLIHEERDVKAANAFAKMLIYLMENKLK